MSCALESSCFILAFDTTFRLRNYRLSGQTTNLGQKCLTKGNPFKGCIFELRCIRCRRPSQIFYFHSVHLHSFYLCVGLLSFPSISYYLLLLFFSLLPSFMFSPSISFCTFHFFLVRKCVSLCERMYFSQRSTHKASLRRFFFAFASA